MTPAEFKKSLTKEQKAFYEAALNEAFSLEEKYYKENVYLRQEIMLMLHALNFQPIQSLPELCEMMRETRKRFLVAKKMAPARRVDLQNQIEAIRGRLTDLGDAIRQVETELNEEEVRGDDGRRTSRAVSAAGGGDRCCAFGNDRR